MSSLVTSGASLVIWVGSIWLVAGCAVLLFILPACIFAKRIDESNDDRSARREFQAAFFRVDQIVAVEGERFFPTSRSRRQLAEDLIALDAAFVDAKRDSMPASARCGHSLHTPFERSGGGN